MDCIVSTGLCDALMMARADRQALLIWFVLVFLTATTYTMGITGMGGAHVVMALLLSVLIKGQLVVDYFMGLKGVRAPWRWLVTGWLLVVVTLIGYAYWLGEH